MICHSTNSSGRLNAFQRLMLQWSELHPYNAAHVYRIARPSDSLALVDAVRRAYAATGLGIVEVDANDLSYHHQTDHEPAVELIAGGADPGAALADHVTKQLNRPFERPKCYPWRFSLLDAEPGAHYVIATYDHWVADSTGARLLLRHVLDRYCEWNLPENRRPLDLYPGTYREVFPHRLGGARLLGAGARSIGNWLRNRSVAQVPYSSSRQMDIRFELYHTESGTTDQLRHFARSLNATVHDVILAALGRAMAEFLPRRAIRKQQAMSLGTIVNARGEAQDDLSDSLGAFLGYYLVRLAADKDMNLADAVRHIAAATGPIKANRAYLDSLVNMKLASAVWPWLRQNAKVHFMRKMLPLTAGVSNVVVRDDWMSHCGDGCIAEYIRGASTGPILPLTLTPTTLGDEMNVGVSYRIAGFSRHKIAGVMERFMEQIEHPAGTRRGRHSRPERRHSTVPRPVAVRRRELVATS
jgi:hypothetical protein